MAKTAVRARTVLLSRGAWSPISTSEQRRASLGLLVLRGMLTRQLRVGPRRSAELMGSGDFLALPDYDSDQYAMVADDVKWRALEPTWLAVLDERFCGRIMPWASILGELLTRSARRSRSLAVRLAIAQVPKLSERLLLLFWHLADRWGQVLPDSVFLPLRLSHEILGDLACAQRPSVSVALRELAHRGLVCPDARQGWRLHGTPPAELENLLRTESPERLPVTRL